MHLISDFCNRLCQASKSKISRVLVKKSNLVQLSLFILYKLGYILYFKIISDKHLYVGLKYFLNRSAIRGIFSLCKPSLKVGVKYKKIQNFAFNNIIGLNGFLIFSTNSGSLLLDIECVLFKSGGVPLWAVY